MSFENPSPEDIRSLLQGVKTIAVVGLSPKPGRPSHTVARALQGFGYRIVPVRPGVSEVLGERAYVSLRDLPFPVDLVDVFRAAEHIPAVVEECIAIGAPAIWIQEGIAVPSPQPSPGGGGGNGSLIPQAGPARGAQDATPVAVPSIARDGLQPTEGPGVRALEAAERACAAGLTVVMDRCLYKDYVRLFTT